MFTLHFILLLGFSTLQRAASQNTDGELVNLGNDSGIISTPDNSQSPSLTKPLRDEFSEDYAEEEFQDNRLRLMLQRKKSLTLNETKLRTWPVNPKISSNVPIISYRNSFPVQSSEDTEISENEITQDISKENSNDHEIVTDFPIINSTSGETVVSVKNETKAIAVAVSEQWPNKKNLSLNNKTSKTEVDSKDIEVDLANVTEEKNSNVTIVTGKFVSSLPPSENTSPQIKNKTINNGATSESTLTHELQSQNISKSPFNETSKQKEGIGPAAGIDSGAINVQQTTDLYPNSKNETQNLENDNFYEELEPDILSEETDIDYITPNETAIDENNTVLIVLPGRDVEKGDSFNETGTFPGKPYISEAISQNLLHLLMNLTAMTAINERNGKKILRELQEQNGQLQSLRKQYDNIYSYITKIKNDKSK